MKNDRFQQPPRHAASGHGLAAKAVRYLIRRAVIRRFATVWSNDPDEVPPGALVICSNHTNWWDGFVAVVATDFLRRRFWLMQEERHLKRYPWFRRCGVIGLDLDGPGSALGGMRRGIGVLRSDPWAALWIFPQGEMVHPANEIVVRPGACLLAGKGGCGMLPLVIRYDWQGGSRPSVWLRWGNMIPSGSTTEELAGEMKRCAAILDEQLRAGEWPDSRALWPPGRPINERWDAVKARFGK